MSDLNKAHVENVLKIYAKSKGKVLDNYNTWHELSTSRMEIGSDNTSASWYCPNGYCIEGVKINHLFLHSIINGLSIPHKLRYISILEDILGDIANTGFDALRDTAIHTAKPGQILEALFMLSNG